MLNQVCIIGRLTHDPDLRHTANGISVTNFTLAVDRDYKSGDKREADFPTFIAWRGAAEFICKNFRKGQLMAVTGGIRTSSFTDKDGKKVYKTDIEVGSAYFADSKPAEKKESSGNAYGGSSTPDFTEAEMDDGDLPF